MVFSRSLEGLGKIENGHSLLEQAILLIYVVFMSIQAHSVAPMMRARISHYRIVLIPGSDYKSKTVTNIGTSDIGTTDAAFTDISHPNVAWS